MLLAREDFFLFFFFEKLARAIPHQQQGSATQTHHTRTEGGIMSRRASTGRRSLPQAILPSPAAPKPHLRSAAHRIPVKGHARLTHREGRR